MSVILIATDGSPAADEAVELGVALAAERDLAVAIVTVARRADVVPVSALGRVDVARRGSTRFGRRLDLARGRAKAAGVPVRTELLVGDPIDEIVAYADSIAADTIVVGSRGRGAIRGSRLGSVSLGVLHEARRPVLVVRDPRRRADEITAAL